MNGWKYITGAGIVGFMLSLISGFASGNPAAVVFFRSFLSAIILAGLAFGTGFVIKRYFPELGGIVGGRDGAKSSESETNSAGGEEVDIVIPEENPHSQTEPEEIEEVEIIEGNEEVGEASDVEVLDEDIESGEGTDKETGPTEGREPSEELKREVSEGESVSEIEIGAVDKLPDLDGLQLDDVETGSKGGNTRGSESTTIKSDVLGAEVDPSTLAKAVRSFMKKDEEG